MSKRGIPSCLGPLPKYLKWLGLGRAGNSLQISHMGGLGPKNLRFSLLPSGGYKSRKLESEARTGCGNKGLSVS